MARSKSAWRTPAPGISNKVLKNLFVPFFTTKTTGTGLGLAISQRIVQNAGGAIDVQSTAGVGTTFTILLPATSLPPPELKEGAASVAIEREREPLTTGVPRGA